MTRANMYAEFKFVGEIGSDSYPGGDLWNELSEQDYYSRDEYMNIVDKHKNGGKGVGNWSYEFNWHPTKQNGEYTDWDNWDGVILVRGINSHLTWKKWNHSYIQVPTQWVWIKEWFIPKSAVKEKIVEVQDTFHKIRKLCSNKVRRFLNGIRIVKY